MALNVVEILNAFEGAMHGGKVALVDVEIGQIGDTLDSLKAHWDAKRFRNAPDSLPKWSAEYLVIEKGPEIHKTLQALFYKSVNLHIRGEHDRAYFQLYASVNRSGLPPQWGEVLRIVMTPIVHQMLHIEMPIFDYDTLTQDPEMLGVLWRADHFLGFPISKWSRDDMNWHLNSRLHDLRQEYMDKGASVTA